MPYIKQHRRNEIAVTWDIPRYITDPGELNYIVTELLVAYVQTHGLKYEVLNAAVGALECAKLEVYRRVASPYEDSKIVSNGDVYPESLITRGQ